MRQAYAGVKRAALAAGSAAAAAGAVVTQEYDNLPVSVVTVASTAALEALRSDPRVEAVEPVTIKQRMLTESLALVDQPQAATRGFAGAGCSIAIIDDGACFAPHAAPCLQSFAMRGAAGARRA